MNSREVGHGKLPILYSRSPVPYPEGPTSPRSPRSIEAMVAYSSGFGDVIEPDPPAFTHEGLQLMLSRLSAYQTEELYEYLKRKYPQLSPERSLYRVTNRYGLSSMDRRLGFPS